MPLFPRYFLPVAGLSLALVTSGCDDSAPPWAGTPDGRMRDERDPFLGRAPESEHDAGTGGSVAEPMARPARFGGLWASCHHGFVPSGEPKRDVTRLGLSCGPANGMRPFGKMITGTAATGRPSRHRLQVDAGDCLRVFAAAGRGIANLDLELSRATGEVLSRDRSLRTWPILDDARPFCQPGATDLLLTISSADGAGSFAAQVWRMPARGDE
jgi:hypothetical protein